MVLGGTFMQIEKTSEMFFGRLNKMYPFVFQTLVVEN